MNAANAAPRTCSTCGGRSYVIVRADDRSTAKVCECAKECRHCGGAGYVFGARTETFSQKVGPRTYETVGPCFCRLLRRRIERFNAARLPGVLSHASLENFKPMNNAHDQARHISQRFSLEFKKGGQNRGFILSGPVGTGKTHLLAASLAHLLLEVGVEARYVEISLLYATIRRGFAEHKSGGEIIGPLCDVDVLAIDELGKGRGSVFELETLDELIARRYNAGKTTLFGTNYSLEPSRPGVRGVKHGDDLKNAAKESDLLRERVGERIYSRLCEMCEFVTLPAETPDYRRMRHELEARPKPRAQR
jgi:DNA replication protein DnaC